MDIAVAQNQSAESSVSRYLKTHFDEAQRKNKSYSLRAFAKKLGITPGGLSQILNQRIKLSLDRAHEFVKHLSLPAQEAEYFLLLVQIENAKTLAVRSMLQEKLNQSFPEKTAEPNLTIDQFRLVSEWYGFAVKEIVSSYGAAWTPTRIANELGITKNEVELTLDRLERLELIEKGPRGYLALQPRTLVYSAIPTEAQENYYHGVISKLDESIGVKNPKKVIATEVMAFDPEDLEEVRRITDEYLDRLIRISKKSKKKTKLYQSLVSFFALGKAEKAEP